MQGLILVLHHWVFSFFFFFVHLTRLGCGDDGGPPFIPIKRQLLCCGIASSHHIYVVLPLFGWAAASSWLWHNSFYNFTFHTASSCYMPVKPKTTLFYQEVKLCAQQPQILQNFLICFPVHPTHSKEPPITPHFKCLHPFLLTLFQSPCFTAVRCH